MTYLRPTMQENLLDEARLKSKRATCLRKRYGALIVRDNIVLSSGYNGAPSGIKDCLECGFCLREQLNVPSGTRYELCKSVHAEQNAVINAAVAGVSIKNGIMYLCGENFADNSLVDAEPCSMCARVIVNAKLEKLIARQSDDSVRIYSLDELREIADRTNYIP